MLLVLARAARRGRVAALIVSVLLVALVGVAPAAEPVSLLAHDGNGRAFDLASLRGQVVVLTFASRYTQRQALEVGRALDSRPAVKVVTVIDFIGIPHLFHGFARRRIAAASGRSRALLLVDERGEHRGRFGAAPDKRVDVYVIDRDGILRGHFDGATGLAAALGVVDALTGQASR